MLVLLALISCREEKSNSRGPEVQIQNFGFDSTLIGGESRTWRNENLLFRYPPKYNMEENDSILYGTMRINGKSIFWTKVDPLILIEDYCGISFRGCIQWSDSDLLNKTKKLTPIVGINSKVKVIRGGRSIILMVIDQVEFYNNIIVISGETGMFFQANLEDGATQEEIATIVSIFEGAEFLK
jgi:hypothetical protein